MMRDLRSITMASPKLFAMNATRWLSGEISARSPKYVRTSMFEGKCCRGSSGDLWPRGSIKQEDRMTTKVRTGRSYHPGTTGCCGGSLRYSSWDRNIARVHPCLALIGVQQRPPATENVF